MRALPWQRALVPTVVAAALGAVLAFQERPAGAAPLTGYDVSWPQCGTLLPLDGDLAIVGVNGGRPYHPNPCLAEQYAWASSAPRQRAFYMNTANPGQASTVVDWYGQKAPNPACSRSDEVACAFNYGYNGAAWAFAHAQAHTGAAGLHSWWLDVELGNSWSADHGLNVAAILGSVSYLRSQGVPVGVYSTKYQWGRITGGVALPDLPAWVAGAPNREQAPRYCAPSYSFTGGPVVLVQWVEEGLDHDLLCLPLPAAPVAPPPGQPDVVTDLLRLDLAGVLADLGIGAFARGAGG